MSDLSRSIRSQLKATPTQGAASRHNGSRRRILWYAGAVVIAVLVIAWIDGGEEPIHPITQEIVLPERG